MYIRGTSQGMALPTRDVQLKILVSKAERAAIQKLADASGLNVSDYLRTLILRETAAKKAAR